MFGDVFVLMTIFGYAKLSREHLSYTAAAPPFSEETPRAFLPLTDKESELFAQNNRAFLAANTYSCSHPKEKTCG